MNGAPTATCTDCLYCKDEPDCLAKIERLTLYPNDGCKSLAEELFAVKTNETLTLRCPGYSGIQSLRDGSWGLHGVFPLAMWLSNMLINLGAVMTVTRKECYAIKIVIKEN
ncbi:thymic stromal lymphopoietin [Hipposideros larvatus]